MQNKAKAGATNVEFLKGHIEAIPLPASSVDVIISNCVINLSTDKDTVLREAFRVLRAGGRLAVSDIVVRRELPPSVKKSMELWSGCVAGALLEAEYVAKLQAAGFTEVEVEPTRVYSKEDTAEMASSCCGEETETALKALDGAVMSAFISPRRSRERGPNPSGGVSPSSTASCRSGSSPRWVSGSRSGRVYPAIGPGLDAVKVGGVSLPIAVGLFWMMYPVLAKVRYGKLRGVGMNRKLFAASLTFNWILGPLLMVALAWLFLPDLPHYRTGLILIGLARCIAMVLLWNMLAKGSNEVAALLVALNSVFQILFYSVLGWFYLSVLPAWLGVETTAFHVSMWAIAKSVLLFLGVPLLAGAGTRGVLVRAKGLAWYESRFLPRVGPTALLGLLYTIVLMFAMQGDKLVRLPFDVVRIAVPLVLYFAIMFGSAFALSKKLGFSYEETASLSFTAAGNNFELAIAVSVGLFGLASGEALAGVVGPLIEVPALLALVYVSLWLRRRLFPEALGDVQGAESPAASAVPMRSPS